MKLLIVGHSHIHALKMAFEGNEYQNLSVDVVNLRAEENFSIFLYKDREDHEERTEIFKELAKNVDAVCASFFGTAYNLIGIANDPQPFDFIESNECKVRPLEKTTYIPHSLFEKQMHNYTRGIGKYLETLRNLTPMTVPILNLESPPPVGSEEYIRNFSAHFSEKVENLGVSPPSVRRKIWKLHEKNIRGYCHETDIHYLTAPKEALNREGLMKNKFCAPDPLHGNIAYGQLVLNNIVATVQKLENAK